MAETHTTIALKKRRDELSSVMRKLASDIAHLDAAIKVMQPKYRPHPMVKGEITRSLLETLREAGRPMSLPEIAEAIEATHQQVREALKNQRRRGTIRGVQQSGEEMVWEVVG